MSTRFRTLASRLTKSERGNTTIMFGLTILPAVMLVGGAIDFGNAYKVRQKVQAAADAAVLAGASMPYETTAANRQAAAVNVFNANIAGISGVTPVAAYDSGTISLTATGAVSTAFLSLAHIYELNVGANSSAAVAYSTTESSTTTTTTAAAGKVCLLALDPNATNGFISQGTPNVNYNGCWGHTNSTKAEAIAGGGGAVVTGAGHSAVGGVSASATGVYSPTPVGGAAAIPDPFATVSAYTLPYTAYTSTFTPPTIATTCKSNGLVLKKGTFTLDPGRYCNGLTIMANATVTFNPGVYVVDNGLLEFQSGAKVTGSDVLFYIPSGTGRFSIQGSGNGGFVNLKGRTSGPDDLKGFLIIVHPNASRGLTSNIQGGTTLEMEGMIYAPTQNILITGNGTSNASSQMFALVAKSFEFRGNGIFNYKPRQATSNLPDIIPTRTTTTTITTTTTSNAVSRVNLK